MKISQEFVVARPLPVVWDFFKDVPKVAACLPGAAYLGATPDGRHTGKVSSKIGPFQASFEGEATVAYDDAANAVHVEGKGVDKRGASRTKMVMDCRLAEASAGTRVAVEADIQLTGAIAQFGRTGLITEIANVLVADFVRNAESELAVVEPAAAIPSGADGAGAAVAAAAEDPAPALDRPPAQGRQLGLLDLIVAALKSWLRSFLPGHAR